MFTTGVNIVPNNGGANRGSSSLGYNFTTRGQVHPRGANFTPGGQLCPQGRNYKLASEANYIASKVLGVCIPIIIHYCTYLLHTYKVR
jgi:hypothetical protein